MSTERNVLQLSLCTTTTTTTES